MHLLVYQYENCVLDRSTSPQHASVSRYCGIPQPPPLLLLWVPAACTVGFGNPTQCCHAVGSLGSAGGWLHKIMNCTMNKQGLASSDNKAGQLMGYATRNCNLYRSALRPFLYIYERYQLQHVKHANSIDWPDSLAPGLTFLSAREADKACCTRARRSAPTYPGVDSASLDKEISGASLTNAVSRERISSLCCKEGIPMNIWNKTGHQRSPHIEYIHIHSKALHISRNTQNQ